MKRITLLRLAGTITWPSFICAGLASVVFFATFDPQELAIAATFATPLSRMAGYTLGFLGFWAVAGLSSLVTAWLILGFSRINDDAT